MAAVAGALSALPLLFLSALAIALAGTDELPPLLWLFLPAVTGGLLVGSVALSAGRGWRLLVRSAVGALVTLLVAIGTGGGTAEEVVLVAVLLVGPALTAVLGCAPDARRWGSRDAQPPPS